MSGTSGRGEEVVVSGCLASGSGAGAYERDRDGSRPMGSDAMIQTLRVTSARKVSGSCDGSSGR